MNKPQPALQLLGSPSREASLDQVRSLVVAGWTGRDKAALEHHIRELEALGVARPTQTPIYYRAAAARLTTADRIETTGEASSGEVEFLLARLDGETWVGVGSDHTDREVEKYNVTVSKQMCEKPIAREFWRFADIADHWDRILMRSYIHENGARVLYQEGGVAAMLEPQALTKGFEGADDLPEGCVMFCGTFAAKGGIRSAARFEFEIEDPVLGRTIRHGYDIVSLPVVG